MAKGKKVMIGFLCLSPVALWIIYMYLSSLFHQRNIPQETLFEAGNIIPGMLGHFMIYGVVIGFILSIILGVRAFLGKGVPDRLRYVWGMLLIFGNVIVLPAYWYLCVWREGSAG